MNRTFFNLANDLVQRGHAAEAIPKYLQALQLNPDYDSVRITSRQGDTKRELELRNKVDEVGARIELGNERFKSDYIDWQSSV